MTVQVIVKDDNSVCANNMSMVRKQYEKPLPLSDSPAHGLKKRVLLHLPYPKLETSKVVQMIAPQNIPVDQQQR